MPSTIRDLLVTNSAKSVVAAAAAEDLVRYGELQTALEALDAESHPAVTVTDTNSIDLILNSGTQALSAVVRRKVTSLAGTEGQINETADGLVVLLGTAAGSAARGSDMAAANAAIAGKAAASHSHAIADVTGLQAALDTKSATSHTHAIADVSGLQAALDAKSATSHTHSDATTSASGFMSAADKTKLNGIAVTKYAANIGDGLLTTIPVVHGLNTQDVVVSVRYAGSPKTVVDVEWSVVDNNTINVGPFGAAPASGALRVVVI